METRIDVYRRNGWVAVLTSDDRIRYQHIARGEVESDMAERRLMKVKRIVANVAVSDPAAAKRFYGDVLGLDVLMDMGWIATYGSRDRAPAQISFMTEGGSGAPVPDLSIEVDDLDGVLARVRRARLRIEYGPAQEPWGVRRFFVRDPFGNLVNVLTHEPVRVAAVPTARRRGRR